jgi:hypothetical protein
MKQLIWFGHMKWMKMDGQIAQDSIGLDTTGKTVKQADWNVDGPKE